MVSTTQGSVSANLKSAESTYKYRQKPMWMRRSRTLETDSYSNL